jgi:hypothetical protein
MMDRTPPWMIVAVLALGATLRCAVAWRFGINSDEPQHLHVVWAWTQGLLPYRDVFDNHMPLFQLLSVPALVLVGERATAVLWMRLSVLPLWVAAVLLTARIGHVLFSSRVGWWSAIIAGLFPLFFFCTLEFRPDDLWTVLWLAAITLAVGGRATPVRSLAVGLALGAALAVSLKAVMMLLAVAVAAGIALALAPTPIGSRRRLATCTLVAAAGVIAMPGAIGLAFALGPHDAAAPFLYGTILHNLAPGPETTRRVSPVVAAIGIAALALIGAWLAVRHTPERALGRRRAFLVSVTATYLALVYCAWPIITRQDMLPVIPLLAVLVTALACDVPRLAAAGAVLLPIIASVELLVVLLNPKWHPREADPRLALTADVLRLAPRGTFVFDAKGESIFRPRPVYWVFEAITRDRMQRGLIADDIAARLVNTRTCVVVDGADYLPAGTRRWLRTHFLRVASHAPAGDVRVAGARFDPAGEGFDVGIPATYALIGPPGSTPHGVLDDRPYDGPRPLAAGFHRYRPDANEAPVALLWAPAVAEGFSPLHATGDRG